MTFIERLQLLERFIGFIKREGTGTPVQMASRLGISKRTLHNLLADLKQMGFEIGYCKDKPTYYFKVEIQVRFFPMQLEKDTESVKGGKRVIFFGGVQDWCTGQDYFCRVTL